MPISKDSRVRSEGFSKIMTIVLLLSSLLYFDSGELLSFLASVKIFQISFMLRSVIERKCFGFFSMIQS